MTQQTRCWYGHLIESTADGRRRCLMCQKRYRRRYRERHPEEKEDTNARVWWSRYNRDRDRYVAAWQDGTS